MSKYSCVRPVHTLYTSYFIEHNGGDEPHDSFVTSLYMCYRLRLLHLCVCYRRDIWHRIHLMKCIYLYGFVGPPPTSFFIRPDIPLSILLSNFLSPCTFLDMSRVSHRNKTAGKIMNGLDLPLGLQEVEAPRISRQSAHENGNIVNLRSPLHNQPPLPPGNIPGTHFC